MSPLPAHKDNSSMELQTALEAGRQGDYAKSIELLRPLAERGNADAQTTLGLLFVSGIGVKKDEGQAFIWLGLAANQGDAMAQYLLGTMYDGVKKDEEQALMWFRRAANQGQAMAQFILGLKYERGDGVKKDNMEAAKWYRLSATQGDKNAQYSLGAMYETGKGGEKNQIEAVKWYRLV